MNKILILVMFILLSSFASGIDLCGQYITTLRVDAFEFGKAGGNIIDRAQNFTVNETCQLEQIELFMKEVGDPDDTYQVRLETQVSAEPSGTLIDPDAVVSGDFSANHDGVGNWHNYSFNSTVELLPDISRFYVLDSEEGSNGVFFMWGVDGDTSTYEPGQAMSKVGGGGWAVTGGTWDGNYRLWGTIGSAVTSSIDLIFRNVSNNEKILFSEGEEIDIFVNYTLSNGTIIDDNFGICNVTLIDGLFRVPANNSNFTLCNTMCDIITNFTREFDLETSDNAVTDSFQMNVCHEQTAQGDIDLTFECGGLSETIVVDAMEFPLCSLGDAFIRKNTSVCIGSQFVNVSSTADLPFAQRKRIVDGAVDREFSTHILTFPGDIFFNSTLNLWNINHTHTYFEHGTKDIFANCSYSPDSTLDNEVAETITIVNLPPEIIFNGVTTNLGFTINADPMVIEYSDDVWNWSGVVIDDDLLHFNVTWYNSSSDIIQQNTTLTNNTLLQTADEFFVDFQNPYNISVTAVDTFGNTSILNVQFNVTDTGVPTYTGLDNTSVEIGTSSDWNATLTDEYLWEFNIRCTGGTGFNHTTTSIGDTTFNFVNTTGVLTSNMLCLFNISDGHTKQDIPDLSTSNTVDTFSVGDLTIGITGMTGITFQKNKDSYSYTITKEKATKELIFNLPEDCIYAENSIYEGHFICSNYWFDADRIEEDVTVDKTNRIVKVSSEGQTSLTFNSIGILNTVSGVQLFTVFTPPLGENEVREFETTPQALFWMFLIIFWFASLIAFLTLKGKRGRKIQLLNLMQCFLGIIVGIGWISRFSISIGIIVLLVAVGIMAGFRTE